VLACLMHDRSLAWPLAMVPSRRTTATVLRHPASRDSPDHKKPMRAREADQEAAMAAARRQHPAKARLVRSTRLRRKATHKGDPRRGESSHRTQARTRNLRRSAAVAFWYPAKVTGEVGRLSASVVSGVAASPRPRAWWRRAKEGHAPRGGGESRRGHAQEWH
jgi:hypothetical protein